MDRVHSEPSAADVHELDEAARMRREADLRLTMSERLAKAHHLCREAAAIAAGAPSTKG